MTAPTRRIRCLDPRAASELVTELRAAGWGSLNMSGDTVTFPSDNPAAVIEVAEYALTHGLAGDADAAALIRSLG